jgi:hypothetical protein
MKGGETVKTEEAILAEIKRLSELKKAYDYTTERLKWARIDAQISGLLWVVGDSFEARNFLEQDFRERRG